MSCSLPHILTFSWSTAEVGIEDKRVMGVEVGRGIWSRYIGYMYEIVNENYHMCGIGSPVCSSGLSKILIYLVLWLWLQRTISLQRNAERITVLCLCFWKIFLANFLFKNFPVTIPIYFHNYRKCWISYLTTWVQWGKLYWFSTFLETQQKDTVIFPFA